MNRTRPATPAEATTEDVSAERILNIVAHHDDDLLFLSPKLITDLQQGKYVQTLFLIASDYPNGRAISDDEYMMERELGVRTAYAHAAGEDATEWSCQEYLTEQKQATLWTLSERVSIVEMRISDGATEPGDVLWWLYSSDQEITTRQGDANDPQTFTRVELGNFLRDVVLKFQPTEIRVGDPLSDHHTDVLHRDHLATARLVRWALDGWGPSVRAFRDYSISDEPQNLTEDEVATKTDVFTAFVRHDVDICPAGGTCPKEEWRGYGLLDWMERQYPVDQNWRQGFVEPLPKPYADNPRSGPHIGGRYKIRNVATGHELAIAGASQADLAGLITWTPANTPNQKFEMHATLGGWLISPLHTGDSKSLDVPGSSQENGLQVIQWRSTGTSNQTLRVIVQPDGSYELVFKHSEMRLTAPATAGGPVTQTYYNANAHNYQKWRFVPIA
jgi:hypothetical protein